LRELDEPEAVATESSWSTGYLDVLLLLLTLFAALLGVVYTQLGDARGGGRANPDLTLSLPPTATPASAESVEPGVILAAMQATGDVHERPQPAQAAEPAAPERALRPLAIKAEAGLSVRPAPVRQTALVLDLRFRRLARSLAETAGDGFEMIAEKRRIRLEVRDRVLFPSGSATLGEAGHALMLRLARALTRSEHGISVEGHTDDLPIATSRFPSNWELSAARAASVARCLIDLGIARDRIQVRGYADTRPRVANDNPANRARNRRVSIVLSLAGPADRLDGGGSRRL
jgi:chemotaxis protein MotB